MIKLFHGIVQKVLDFGPYLEYNGTINIEFMSNNLITL